MLQNKLSHQYLKIKISEQLILLPLTQVKIVLRLPALHDVPSQTKGFQGMLNYHGTSVAIYDLAIWVGTGSIDYTLDTPLILCELQKELIGFLVSDVIEVAYIKRCEIQSHELSSLPDFVKGTYESEKESMWVIQLDELVSIHSPLMQAHHE